MVKLKGPALGVAIASAMPGSVLAGTPGLLYGGPIGAGPARVRFAKAAVPGDDFHAALLERRHPAILGDRAGAHRLYRAPRALISPAGAKIEEHGRGQGGDEDYNAHRGLLS
jgi:hypothetical protein